MENALPRRERLNSFFQDHFTLIRENRKLIAQFILMFLIIVVGSWFIKHEQTELHQVRKVLLSVRLPYLIAGLSLTALYLILQSVMYKLSFAAVGNRVPFSSTILLYLKRNFIGVFIPAGGVTSLAFFTGEIEKKGISKSKIHFASSIYGFVGILSVVIVAIPI